MSEEGEKTADKDNENEPILSNYFEGLPNETKERYLEKIRIIGNIDPYNLKPKDLIDSN